jgi:hypothetical protein
LCYNSLSLLQFPDQKVTAAETMRAFDRAILAALGLLLAGCSSGPVIDMVPAAVGGLPSGTPARPTTTSQFPAVHDMPPPRADAALTADDQAKMEKGLKAARDQVEAEGKAVADGKAELPAKKHPAAAQKPKPKKPAAKNGATDGETTGAKINP